MSMKFRAHDTFFIRKGWLSKGMKYVHQKPDVFTDKMENPMDVLGIGANMVKALRYWLQAVELTEEIKGSKGKRIQKLTPFGELVFQNDKYIEEVGTLYLLQYMLAKNNTEATAWYYFFNEFNMSEFTRDNFTDALQNYVRMNGEKVAQRSLADDFNCIINTYLPKYKTNPEKVSPENNIDCPFGELGLIDIIGEDMITDKRVKEKLFRKSIPAASTFHPWVIMAVIIDQMPKDTNEITLGTLLNSPNNIGKVFNLDAITMLDILHRVERMGSIKIVRTAGLDVIQVNSKNKTFIDCVRTYYANIDNNF